MLSENELAISCAVAALAIMRIIHLRRRWLKVREQLRTINSPWDASRQSIKTSLENKRSPRDPAKEKEDLFYNRLVVIVLVLAALWFVGRIFMGA